MSQCSNEVHIPDVSSIDLKELLPICDDEDTLRENFAVLIGRTLAKYIPFFTKFCKHIAHEFSHEISQKSEVVSSAFLVLWNKPTHVNVCMHTH